MNGLLTDSEAAERLTSPFDGIEDALANMPKALWAMSISTNRHGYKCSVFIHPVGYDRAFHGGAETFAAAFEQALNEWHEPIPDDIDDILVSAFSEAVDAFAAKAKRA